MVSAAEQMAANLNWGSFGKAKELQARILFALGLLIVYRIGTYVPIPGIDTAELARFFERNQGGLGDIINVFTGAPRAWVKFQELGLEFRASLVIRNSYG